MEYFKYLFVAYLFVINIVSFIMIGYDKRRARKNEWRVPEKRFFALAFIGGAFGIYFGMKLFRHKTKHLRFTLGIPLIIILNLAILFYFIVKVYN